MMETQGLLAQDKKNLYVPKELLDNEQAEKYSQKTKSANGAYLGSTLIVGAPLITEGHSKED